ncbi:hypothetical protein TVAG_104820 [Trichomonas vaginalis G3]|uniref:Uncharacterized protein n=1 Tax=Trichomonas vaginalis (strain ATCC PRA-98 / G3) TaxID=412133 RepID=A2G067_TRIV3|nr:hypothetical protein TVAGG3_0045520 [Trichomonas vaginalis G3]EAX89445.1 hypothetical protein TVAG_104820 [Trichomonas vaginalis G3]KAI5540999.1 hypothetical protein TVAGG3_0045520 [Trichomonas vaginalis G3]|eukprot:XP_001302375.1 hypothetical protein [Trichomonas vaginalis G3]
MGKKEPIPDIDPSTISTVDLVIYDTKVDDKAFYFVLATQENGAKVNVWINQQIMSLYPEVLDKYLNQNPCMPKDQETETPNFIPWVNSEILSDSCKRTYTLNFRSSCANSNNSLSAGALITKIKSFNKAKRQFSVEFADCDDTSKEMTVPDSFLIEFNPQLVIDFFLSHPEYISGGISS